MLVGHHRTDNSAYDQTTFRRSQVNEPVAPAPSRLRSLWPGLDVDRGDGQRLVGAFGVAARELGADPPQGPTGIFDGVEGCLGGVAAAASESDGDACAAAVFADDVCPHSGVKSSALSAGMVDDVLDDLVAFHTVCGVDAFRHGDPVHLPAAGVTIDLVS